MYARVNGSSVVETAAFPHDLVRLSDGGKVLFSDYITHDELAACGWYQVVEPAPPLLTAQQTRDPDTIEVVAGVPTRVFHVRNKTQPELDADAAVSLTLAERQQAREALADLDQFIDRGNANTNVQVRDAVLLHARILKRLIKDALGG